MKDDETETKQKHIHIKPVQKILASEFEISEISSKDSYTHSLYLN